MTNRERILARFSGGVDEQALWLPDLNLWHGHHSRRGTLPAGLSGASLAESCRALGFAAFLSVRPYRVELDGAEMRTEEVDGERVVRAATSAGSLVARWTLMPDGEWWQTEYPVKSAEDLPAARALIAARRYLLDASDWSRADAEVGGDGVAALELPRRPFSEVLHTLLGWSEGLVLLMDGERAAVLELVSLLEDKVQACVQEIARLPGSLAYSPDNLDGSFISPGAFAEHLAPSYRRSVEALESGGMRLVVHVGGPAGRLLRPLAEAGVAGVEGVCGQPQGDSPLGDARRLAGRELTLWGGLPQDCLLGAWPEEDVERAASEAAALSAADPRVVVGIADQVPVGADLDELRRVGDLVGRWR